ncbi:Hypothetical predicted protein [Scomber scombrus]|uniref:Uncharacterized protein n=1 Tax=Scomber scombrus TaxID=13677 RepID=A0AAV1PFP9_SCOSC
MEATEGVSVKLLENLLNAAGQSTVAKKHRSVCKLAAAHSHTFSGLERFGWWEEKLFSWTAEQQLESSTAEQIFLYFALCHTAHTISPLSRFGAADYSRH